MYSGAIQTHGAKAPGEGEHLVCSIAQAPEGGVQGAAEAAAQRRVRRCSRRAQALAGRRLHQRAQQVPGRATVQVQHGKALRVLPACPPLLPHS